MKNNFAGTLCLLATMALAACGESTPPDWDMDYDGGNDSDDTVTTVDSDTNDDTDVNTDTTVEWSSCETTSECLLAANSCCGVCGAPSLSDLDGVNKDKTGEHFADVCEETDPMCPDCPVALNPELVATCSDAGHCLAVDIGEEAFSACTSSEDCVIRTPECCECGADISAFALVAIRADSRNELTQIVCDPVSMCPECAPVYPQNAKAICDTDGHCAVAIAQE